MFGFNRDVLGQLDIVDGLEDRETLADGRNAHFLQAFGVEKAEDIAGYVVLWNAMGDWSYRRDE